MKDYPRPNDELPDDNGGDGGNGGNTPSDPKTWWQKNWMPVVGIGTIVIIVGVILLIALL